MSNGYCTINIKGKKLGIKFGLESLFMIDEKMKKINKVPRVGNIYDLLTLSYYAYAGHYCNCLVKDVEEEFSYEDFHDYFEDSSNDPAFIEEVKKMMDVFNASIQAITDKNKGNTEDTEQKKTKKKPTGKKSKGTASDSD